MLGEKIATKFTCSEGANYAPILYFYVESCEDSNGSVVKGIPGVPFAVGEGTFNTSSPGPHTYTVTAHSGDGLSESASINYVVVGPPAAHIEAPASGSTYVLGETVHTHFSCSEYPSGPGLEACEDSNGLKTEKGGQGTLNTTTPGTHTYTVKARSKDGQSAETSITYTVAAPPPTSAPHGTAAPSIELVQRKAAVTRGLARIVVLCKGASGTRCVGRMSLTLRRRLVRNSHGKRLVRHREVVIAEASFSLPSVAHDEVVTLKVRRPFLPLLARSHAGLRVSVTLTLQPGKGVTRALRLVVRRQVRRKHRPRQKGR